MKIIYFPLVIVALVIVSGWAEAQTVPEFMVTWKAANYAPADYQGKVLPAAGTRVDIAMELIDGSRLADTSRSTISWNVNGQFQKSGVGLKNFFFTADGAKGDQLVRVSLPYKGRVIDKQIVIPLAAPRVVITGGPDIFKALLYSFNFSSPTQAKITWTVNGAATEGAGNNPEILTLIGTSPSGTPVNIGVEVQNLLKPLEVARRSMNFIQP